MESNATSIIRDIFVMVAAGAFAALCLVLIAVIAKLYRPLRDTAHNSARASENLRKVTGDFSRVSEETANNVVQTSRNLVDITEKGKEGTEELSGVVHSASQASQSIAAAAATAARIAEMVSRLIPQGEGDSAAASGVGSLLRFVRDMFGSRRPGGGARQQP